MTKTPSGLQYEDIEGRHGRLPDEGPDLPSCTTRAGSGKTAPRARSSTARVDRGTAVLVPGRPGTGHQGLGRGRRDDEGRRQAHPPDPARSRLRLARRRRRHSAQRHADLRSRAARRSSKPICRLDNPAESPSGGSAFFCHDGRTDRAGPTAIRSLRLPRVSRRAGRRARKLLQFQQTKEDMVHLPMTADSRREPRFDSSASK